MDSKRNGVIAFFVLGVLLQPHFALASGLSEFDGPLETLMGTITGPVGRYTSIIAMALIGVTFIFKREEISGVFKTALGVVFAICFIVFASSMVDSMFSFNTGALI